jgi:acyl carrier protein
VKTQEIRERLTALIESISYGQKGDAAKTTFILLGEDGMFDSVTALRLLLSIETEFGIVVEDSDLKPDNFGSLENLERYVTDKLKAKAR